MNLPGGEKNTAIVVKDPTKPNFWRFRNIALLMMTAILPALTGWIYTKSEQSVTNYFNKQKSQDERIRALEEDTQERLRELENDHANNKAIWEAITDERNRIAEQEIEIRVIQRLFDREFRRASLSGVPPAKESGVMPVGAQADPAIPRPPAIKPDQYRLEKELKNPQQKK